MSYVISFNDKTDKFVMGGYEADFIMEFLMHIGIHERILMPTELPRSESEVLALLRGNGAEIELVNIDW